jgi:hypothetical protein
MATSLDVGLVTVAVRPRFHDQVIRPLLRSGKMVYCEWPLGLNLVAATELGPRSASHALAPFHQAWHSGSGFHPNFADGLRLRVMMEAISESSATQR